MQVCAEDLCGDGQRRLDMTSRNWAISMPECYVGCRLDKVGFGHSVGFLCASQALAVGLTALH